MRNDRHMESVIETGKTSQIGSTIPGFEIPTDPAERHRFFFEVLRADNQRKARRRAELVDLVKNVPISDAVLSEIAWGWSDLLKHHPGFEADRKLRALSSMLMVFYQAHKDLTAQLDRFHSFTLSEHFGRRSGKQPLREIEQSVDKEVVAFSMGAMSLVDHERGLRGVVKLDGLDERRSAVFDQQEHRFITELRNMISHGQFPDLSWQVTYGTKRLTAFTLRSEDLLDNGNIHNDARAFIFRSGDRIHIGEVANSYVAKVRLFYDWYLRAVEASIPSALADYRRCRRVCTATSTRTWHRAMMHHYIQWRLDPYQHLDKYLLPDEVDAVMRMPMRSKEQVDYIIAAVDEYDVCDDELRSMTYQLFGVPAQG